MAIYHLSVKPISRSSGKSSTGAAAYRSAEKVIDERTGEMHDYRRKGGVEFSEIVTPVGATWTPSRSELWNAAELAEKRKDACVAREHEIALPRELSADDRLDLARKYAKDLADRHGCAVDLAIHAPHKDKDGQSNDNYHAHLLCTTRQVEGAGLGPKCDREKAGRNRKADLEEERALWADLQNTALELAGHQVQVSHLSLEAQGIDRQPTTHLGPVVTAMQRDGRASDVLDRLTAAREAGERERAEAKALDAHIINLTGDLHQALAERNQQRAEHDRVRTAALGRIGANLSAADQHHDRLAASLNTAGRAFEQLRHADPIVAKAGTDYQHARGTGAAIEAVGAAVGRAVPEVARATARILQVVAEQRRIEAKKAQTLITPSMPLSPAKPQQSALAQAREARAQAEAAREASRARRAALFSNRTPTPEPEPPKPSLAEQWNAKPAKEMVGPIVAVEGRTVIQSAGRGQYVVHELAPDSPIPPVSDVSRTIRNGTWKKTPKEFAQDLVAESRQKAAEKEADKIIDGREISPEDRAELVKTIREDRDKERELQREKTRSRPGMGR